MELQQQELEVVEAVEVDLHQLDLLVILVEMVVRHLEIKPHKQELLTLVVVEVVDRLLVEFQQVLVEQAALV
tara:strand:+ start:291 stop:506 length:216 start_codon:yes stop_codon:yes gene_type:complete